MKSFKDWTQADVDFYNAKRRDMLTATVEAVESEKDLHAEIIQFCKNRRWIYFHGSMARATGRTIGETDFCCLLPKGVVLFCECKSKTGKLSAEQTAMKFHMELLGHSYHVIRSMAEFVSLVASSPQCPAKPQDAPRRFPGLLAR